MNKRSKIMIPVLATALLFGAVPAMAAEQAVPPMPAIERNINELDPVYVKGAEQFLQTVFGLLEVKLDSDYIEMGENMDQKVFSFQYPGGVSGDKGAFIFSRPNTITVNKDGSVEYATMKLSPDGAKPTSLDVAEKAMNQIDSEGKAKLQTMTYFKKYNESDEYLQFRTDHFSNESDVFGFVAMNASSGEIYNASFAVTHPIANVEQNQLLEAAKRVLKSLLGKEQVEITSAVHGKELKGDAVKETWSYSTDEASITLDTQSGQLTSLFKNNPQNPVTANMESKEEAMEIANPLMKTYFGIDLAGYESSYQPFMAGPDTVGWYDYKFSKEGQASIHILFTVQGGVQSIITK